MTQEQQPDPALLRERIFTAIDRAQGYGKCLYVSRDTGEPQCVIAQLMAIEGVDMSYFKEDGDGWRLNDQLLVAITSSATPVEKEHPAYQAITSMIDRYDGDLSLQALQRIWDEGRHLSHIEESDIAAAREEMRGMVREAWGE